MEYSEYGSITVIINLQAHFIEADNLVILII